MSFAAVWLPEADSEYQRIRAEALAGAKKATGKSTKAQGLFKQVHKTITMLLENPRHPGLQTHEYHAMSHPFAKQQKVFEAYVQNRSPGAYRIFWCYGPEKNQITIIAITPHP